MVHKSPLPLLLQLLTILLGFSLVAASSVRVPASSRILLSNGGEEVSRLSATQTALRRNVEEEIEGKMDLENTDYPGTGPNNRHVPKTPATP